MILIKVCICFSYFIIGGLATTNILRLLKGSTVHVYDSRCACPKCGMKISAINQTPIVSYIFNKGKCKQCKSHIPVDALILEIVVFTGMSLISIVGDFSPLSVALSFVYYEIIRIILVRKNGRRESDFARQCFLAMLSMSFLFLLIEFLAGLLLCL